MNAKISENPVLEPSWGLFGCSWKAFFELALAVFQWLFLIVEVSMGVHFGGPKHKQIESRGQAYVCEATREPLEASWSCLQSLRVAASERLRPPPGRLGEIGPRLPGG